MPAEVGRQLVRSIYDSMFQYQGIYKFTLSGVVQAATQNGTSSAFFWLINPLTSTINIALKRLQVITQMGTALSTPSVPALQFNRFTFTGIASGASITPSKRRTSDASPQGSIRTAITGLTPSLGAAMWTTYPIVTTGTAGWSFTQTDENDFIEADLSEYEWDVLVPGEGIVFWQNGAGTASDTRIVAVNGSWVEWIEPA